jgi:hypothetical protein
MSEFIQLEIGISTNLYFPAIGTAGFERSAVSGESLVPAPPPNITAIVFLLILSKYCYESLIFKSAALCNFFNCFLAR